MAQGVIGRRWPVVLIAAAAVVAVVAAVVAARFAVPADAPATPRPTRARPEMTMVPGMTMTPGMTMMSGTPSAVMVHLSELTIEPKDVTVAEGGTLEVMNVGTMPHSLAVSGTPLATKILGADRDEGLVLTGLAAGTYTINCTVPGHAEAGMVAALYVVPRSG